MVDITSVSGKGPTAIMASLAASHRGQALLLEVLRELTGCVHVDVLQGIVRRVVTRVVMFTCERVDAGLEAAVCQQTA